MITNNLAVIAAICGNFFQESGINPGIWENLTVGANGYGLGQWTDNAQTSRRTALFNWLSANGYSQDSGEGQLKFLVQENLWIPSLFVQSAYNTLGDYLNSTSTNIGDLVQEFMYHWEGINDGTYNTRFNYATYIYNEFLNDDGTRNPWYSGNYYLTRGQTDSNAMLVKDFFLDEIPITDAEILALVSIALKRRKKGGGIIVF